MRKIWRKTVALTVASAFLFTGLQAAAPVQAATKSADTSCEKPEWDIPTLKGSVRDGYVMSPNSVAVPAVSNTAAGLKGAGTVPSAYMNTLSQLVAKYPSTRNQGGYSTCWAFSAIGLAEFDLITDDRTADRSIDLSELQLSYFSYNNAEDAFGNTCGDGLSVTGNKYLQAGGNLEYCVRTLLQWEGVINEADMPYANVGMISSMSEDYAFQKDVAHLQNVYIINIHKNPNLVKKEVMQHGSAGIGFYFADTAIYDGSGEYEGELVTTYNCPKAEQPNHAANIVGWDDNFPAANFANKPAGNGAWLVRNSWSDSAKNDITSYFWLSYYDKSLEDAAWIMDFEAADNYEYIYQYDGCPLVYKAYPFSDSANVFMVKGASNELLKAVSITLNQDTNVPYTIKVYTNLTDSGKPKSGVLAAQVSGKTSYAGTYTIPLNKSVSLPKGSYYSIVVELNKKNAGIAMECGTKSGNLKSTAGIEYNQSFVSYQGQWQDLVDVGEYQGIGNLCIKGYTDKTGTSVSKTEKLRASSVMRNSVKLSWSGTSGAQGYEIYRAASRTGSYKKVATVKEKSYKNTGLTKGKTYYYKVRAYKKNGDTTVVGKLSSAVKVTTKK